MSSTIHRVTMFKIPKVENQKKLLAAYEVLARDQKKVREHSTNVLSAPPFPLFDPMRTPPANLLPLPPDQDGKPYILYMAAGQALEDQRTRGFTIVAKSEFASLDDLRFYDEGCEAHDTLKQTAKTLELAEPPLTVFFEGAPVLDVRGK